MTRPSQSLSSCSFPPNLKFNSKTDAAKIVFISGKTWFSSKLCITELLICRACSRLMDENRLTKTNCLT
jgi:hypothetical protein